MLLSASSGNTNSSAGSIDLGIRFFLQDQFSGPVQRMKAGLGDLKKEFNSLQDNLRAARSFYSTGAAMGMAATYGLATAVSEGAEFLFILRSVEAITEASVNQMEALRNKAVEVGRETIFDPKDIAGGMRFMAMAGQKAETIRNTIGAASNLAGATLTHLEGKMGAADILTNALKAFGWEDARSGQMADILTMAANSANVTLTDLGNSIRYVAATSRNLRIPVEETTGFLMSLGNAGIQASMAGVATENMYRYLAMSLSKFPTKRAQSAWASMGIDKSQLTDSVGNLKPVYEILGMIKSRISTMGSVEQQNILRDIFGVRGLRAAGTLINNLDEAVGFIKKLQDPSTAGTAQKKMETMMDSLKGAIDRVRSGWEGVLVMFTAAVEGPLKAWLVGLSKGLGILEKFFRTPFGKFTAMAITGLTVAVTLTMTLRAALAALAYTFRTLTVTTSAMAASVSKVAYAMTGRASAYGLVAGIMGVPNEMKAMKNAPGYNAMQAASRRPLIVTPAMVMGAAAAKSAQAPGHSVTQSIGKRQPMAYGPTVGAVVPTGAVMGAKYRSPKTGAFVSHRVVTPMVGPTSPIYTGPKVPNIMPIVGATSRVGGSMLKGLSIVGRGLMGLVGGPVGLGIVAASFAIPWLVDKLSNNTQAVDKNTEAIIDANSKATSSEYYALIANYKVVDVVSKISTNLERLLSDRKIDMNRVTEILQSQDPSQWLELLGPAMVGSANPLILEPH